MNRAGRLRHKNRVPWQAQPPRQEVRDGASESPIKSPFRETIARFISCCLNISIWERDNENKETQGQVYGEKVRGMR